MPLRRSRSNFWLVLILAPFAFLGGMVADRAVFASRGNGVYQQLDLFSQVLAYIENNYVEDVPEQQLVQGAIKGMVSTLDPHTIFMPPEVFKELKIDTSGEFGGLGIELTTKVQLKNGARTESLMVVAPVDETPAARAGIKSGDIILKIDGISCSEMDLASAVSRMRGPAGTKVVLTILRAGFSEPREIVIVRDHIQIVSVEGKLYDGYGYVKIKSFQDNTDRHLKRVLGELREQNKGALRGLVLDLRNNPGGLLDQAVKVSDRFLPGGLVIVTTKGRNGRQTEQEKSHDRDTEPGYPMVALVNGGSASASEIVAGALQDHGRATVMGQPTFGKGSVQTLIELEDGSGLKLTIARYYTPKGRSIQESGIQPDLLVGTNEEGIAREVDLKNHFKNSEGAAAAQGAKEPLTLSKNVEKAGKTRNQNGKETEDLMLKTALGYLKTWQTSKTSSPPKTTIAK